MGKPLDKLNLTDEPIASAKPIDPRDTNWYKFAREIDDLLSTGSYTWAEDTLTDIQATVERMQNVTEGQRKAVENIENGNRPSSSNRWREGFRGRRR